MFGFGWFFEVAFFRTIRYILYKLYRNIYITVDILLFMAVKKTNTAGVDILWVH